MALRHELWREGACELSHDIIQSIRRIDDEAAIRSLIGDFGHYIWAPWWAFITHEDLRVRRPGLVDYRHYPWALRTGSSSCTSFAAMQTCEAAYSSTPRRPGPNSSHACSSIMTSGPRSNSGDAKI